MPSARRLTAFALAAFGVALFRAAGLPLPFLLGPMAACLAGALAGLRMEGAPRISEAMRTVLGVAIGASVTPELVDRLGTMAASVVLIPLFTLACAATGAPLLRRAAGLDRVTAYYAAVPGGLTDMVILGGEAGGDIRAISLIHVTRVLVIVSVAPALMALDPTLSLDRPPGAPAGAIPPLELALMALAAVVGLGYARRVGLFGAALLGPLFAAALLALVGRLTHRPPAEALLAAQFFIGLSIGVTYVGVTASELRRIVSVALLHCVALAALTALFVLLSIRLAGATPLEAALAFAPGGQAEMAILALIAGADVAFVVTHHMLRMVVVLIGAPLGARVARRGEAWPSGR